MTISNTRIFLVLSIMIHFIIICIVLFDTFFHFYQVLILFLYITLFSINNKITYYLLFLLILSTILSSFISRDMVKENQNYISTFVRYNEPFYYFNTIFRVFKGKDVYIKHYTNILYLLYLLGTFIFLFTNKAKRMYKIR